MDDSRWGALAHQSHVWVVTTPAHVDELLQQLGPNPGRIARRFPRAVVLEAGPNWPAALAPRPGSTVAASGPVDHGARTIGRPTIVVR